MQENCSSSRTNDLGVDQTSVPCDDDDDDDDDEFHVSRFVLLPLSAPGYRVGFEPLPTAFWVLQAFGQPKACPSCMFCPLRSGDAGCAVVDLLW